MASPRKGGESSIASAQPSCCSAELLLRRVPVQPSLRAAVQASRSRSRSTVSAGGCTPDVRCARSTRSLAIAARIAASTASFNARNSSIVRSSRLVMSSFEGSMFCKDTLPFKGSARKGPAYATPAEQTTRLSRHYGLSDTWDHRSGIATGRSTGLCRSDRTTDTGGNSGLSRGNTSASDRKSGQNVLGIVPQGVRVLLASDEAN